MLNLSFLRIGLTICFCVLSILQCMTTCVSLVSSSDQVYQLLSHGRWFSSGFPASSTTKIGRHDIAEILLKVALKHQKINQSNLSLA